MNIAIKNSYNPNFNSRCKEIELARGVCRKMSVISPSKKYAMLNHSAYIASEPKAVEFYKFADKRRIFMDDHYMEYHYSERCCAVYKILCSNIRLSTRLDRFRRKLYESDENEQSNLILEQVLKNHVGNCGELSCCAQIILNLNNIKNAYTAVLTSNGDEIDHRICLFNRDGSEFDGKINNNNTIIVDPWLGIVDFANTALKTIKNCYGKYFNLSSEDRLNLTDIRILKPPKCNSNEYKVHK